MHPCLWVQGMRPLWRLTSKQQIKFDANYACIIIPPGYKKSFVFAFPMKNTSWLRSSDLIKLCLTQIFLFCLTNGTGFATKEYVAFIAMLHKDLCLIMSPQVRNEDIGPMEDKLIETMSVLEGILAPSEYNFLLHQLVELPSQIYHSGPLMDWGGASGERMLGTIKSLVNKGGRSFEKSLVTTFCNLELANFRKYLNNDTAPPSYFQNTYYYINISGTSDPYHFNTYEKDCILYQLLLFIFKFVADDESVPINERKHREYNSGIFRLYQAYKYYKSTRNNDDINFMVWIDNIYTDFVEDELESNGIHTIIDFQNNRGRRIDINKVDFQSRPELFNSLKESLQEGFIATLDLDVVNEIHCTLSKTYAYYNASILSINHHGRGIIYTETDVGQRISYNGRNVYIPNNNLNDLQSNWYNDDNTNSWCLLNDVKGKSFFSFMC
jgi:hypothetical protein